MSIKVSFSIKDLENLSGVKAHTIRIWEKRYNLLEPMRSDTNIRSYDLANLQKILNVALLIENGYKVSKIASIKEDELYRKVRELMIEKSDSLHSVNSFKLAMLNFDQQLFDHTYNQLLAQSSFREIFLNVFLRLLNDIGMLWVTKTITPAHEHFISTLIKQKLLLNIERVQTINSNPEETYVLYLPMNEIHELGLLYVHFELLLKGKKSIYLGPSVPVENLLMFQGLFPKVTYVSYFTVEPVIDKVDSYLNDVSSNILSLRDEKLVVIGRNVKDLDPKKYNNIEIHEELLGMIEAL